MAGMVFKLVMSMVEEELACARRLQAARLSENYLKLIEPKTAPKRTLPVISLIFKLS